MNGFRIGDEIEIKIFRFTETVTVKVVDMHLAIDSDKIACIVTLQDGDGNRTTAGAFHLARWMENAKASK
jgi:hypothetical protein